MQSELQNFPIPCLLFPDKKVYYVKIMQLFRAGFRTLPSSEQLLNFFIGFYAGKG